MNYRKFSETRTAAENPLKAAQVYEDIVKAIDEAENEVEEASKAAEDATKQANIIILLFVMNSFNLH